MVLQDNVLKAYLKNVYFITGTACGGKSTAARALADKYGLTLYDIDKHFDGHQALSDAVSQPNMNRRFADADAFFGRPVEAYRQWLIDNTREQWDYVLLDLIRLSQERPVVCDCHMTVEEARRLTDPSRVIFLIRDVSYMIEDYCNRPDHQGFRDYINSASDPQKAKENCNTVLRTLNERRIADIKTSEYRWIERTDASRPEDTLRMVEQHFGLTGPEICKVDKDTPLARQLIEFVEHFSWEEVKEHTLQNLNNWVFTDWETLFVARIDGKIVGMASLFKTDYYPLPEIYPWVSSLFVTEAYRGQRISQKLVDYANDYAKSLGFERTYIPSEHVGLYEKYGYTYLKDIVNYGGGVDRLYVKELKE